MLTEQDILGLLTGTLPAEQRARVADELARDPEAARRAFGTERLAAVAILLGHATSPTSMVTPSPAAARPLPPPTPAVSAEEALREALCVAGKDGWAYRPPKGAPAPGLSQVVTGAFQEWCGTWHGRLVLLLAALALAYAAFRLVNSGPPLMHSRTPVTAPLSGPSNAPAPAPVPALPVRP